MKVLCPHCEVPIDLGYLEKNGAQMASCPGCSTVVAATFKKDDKRVNWKFEIETPQSKNNVEDHGCGCGAAILMAIALSILFSMAQCDSQVPDTPPADTPAGEDRN
jgi:hypothetical protein